MDTRSETLELVMKDAGKKIVVLDADTISADKMLVTLNVGELRDLIGEVVEQKLKRLPAARSGGLLNAEQAAEFLSYSKDWVYKNWQRIGGKKIGGKGVRFEVGDLQKWVASRNSA